MLLAFAEHAPLQKRWRGGPSALVAGFLLGALAAMTGQFGIDAVDWFHVVTERAVAEIQL